MDYLVVAVMGAVLGATVVVWVVLARHGHPRPTLQQHLSRATVTVPDGVSQVFDVLRSAGVVVGPHDEVLLASPLARDSGLVRGSRVVHRELLEVVRDVRRGGELRSVDLELTRGGDQVSHFAVRVAPLQDQLLVVLAEDRTEAVRLEAIRRDFVTNVSHELKTPIGAVSLLAEAVQAAAEEPETVRSFALRMQHESSRLSSLVAQIIQLSGIQADDPLLSPRWVSVDAVLAEAVDACRVDAENRGVVLRQPLGEGLWVRGDPHQLVMAVGNLVRNAVIYSGRGDRVSVSARRLETDGEQQVELRVSDTGIGIAAADLERIFERFYRVDYGRSRSDGGNGLGLAIVKHVTAAHGGRVSVWSKPGQGSTFSILLPEQAEDSDGADRGQDLPRHEEREVAR